MSTCQRGRVCSAAGTKSSGGPFFNDGWLQMQWSNVVRRLVVELSTQQEWHAGQVTKLGLDCRGVRNGSLLRWKAQHDKDAVDKEGASSTGEVEAYM